jgi:glutathione synthase
VTDLDVILLRNDPSLDAEDRPWAAHAGIVFGQLAAQRGVIVLNDPEGLGQAWNKLYFQTYPEEVRPKTLISKNPDDIREFVKSHRGKHILKPLQSSGGRNVFLLGRGNDNLNQIIETISEEGYVIAQGYLPKAEGGDVRLFMMNGKPLQVDGAIAALQRVPSDDDIRSNMHAGGEAVKAELTEAQLHVAELVRPKLIRDGMFLVGLDIVGEKILEVNVFSPGGLWSCSELHGVDFATAILEAIEKKVQIRNRHLETFSNRELATL